MAVLTYGRTNQLTLQKNVVSALAGLIVGMTSLACMNADANDGNKAFLPRSITSSTIPPNGDLNPYGVAFVPSSFPSGGTLMPGDLLVSNFNNIGNLQGTGTTIVKFTPTGDIAPGVAGGTAGNATVFYQSTLTGLSTALGVLKGGFVVVGNVPTTDGTSATVSNGALQVIDISGNLVATLTDSTYLDSPWDLTINDRGSTAQIFVSNVLSGTVSRLDVMVSASGLTISNEVQIATGYTHEPNDAALVLGPTGLAYDPRSDTLFVASTADNEIFAVPKAGRASAPVTMGNLVFSDPHLRGPLALVFAPNGNLLTANGDAVNADVLHPSEIVEFTRWGTFVSEYNVDASQGGSFGIATVLSSRSEHSHAHGTMFNYAAIDDVANDIVVTFIDDSDD